MGAGVGGFNSHAARMGDVNLGVSERSGMVRMLNPMVRQGANSRGVQRVDDFDRNQLVDQESMRGSRRNVVA